ncbi:MAG: type IV secretion system DNA-binding domain-containing protein [bacterium]|nr:type IV secretion system DNA-binding domain-containing protein [bacterium]
METTPSIEAPKKLGHPQEEIDFLNKKIASRVHEFKEHGGTIARTEAISREIKSYQATPAEQILEEKYRINMDEIKGIAWGLSAEHDHKLDSLIEILGKKGIKNALSVCEELGSPHIEDDFHRFLVQYLAHGSVIPGLKEGTPLSKALHMKLYEVTLPPVRTEGEKHTFAELVSAMSHFYSGMLSVGGNSRGVSANYFALEVSNGNASEEVIFYAATPTSRAELFEKQILAVYPHARIKEHEEDYNPFNDQGVTVASVAISARNPALTIKTYKEFDHDPLHVIVNAFSKIKKDGEGAALQLIISPSGESYNQRYKMALTKVKKGVSLKEALQGIAVEITKGFLGIAKELISGPPKKNEDEKEKHIDETTVKLLEQKIASPIFETNIRIITSAETESRAEAILSDLESAFNQFGKTEGNSIAWKRAKGGHLSRTLYDFSFRAFSENEAIPLNADELTTMFHFPVDEIQSSHLKEAKGASASIPAGIQSQGIILGLNKYRGGETQVHFGREDRMRHFYAIGQTGTGKTNLLKNMIMQDIVNGDGVCMIDPHGTDIADILSIIPKERIDDVIYFDPAYTARPMGLNMLEYDTRYPEQKTFVVNEMLSIFSKLFDMKVAGGPMFEQYFRNATMLVIEDPTTGNTLLEVSRVLSSSMFRELKLARCKNPVVVQFWREVAGKAGGEASLANIVPYITSKFDVFLANDIMRPIVAQEKSAFNFRHIMDEKKILLVNLSKGRLGDINSNLIGLILVGKILMAALSRVDSLNEKLPDFYLYIDEFQNVTTDSIATILSEARKYRLSLNVAHQFIAQLDEKIKDAVFGNVGSLVAFRVGAEDAETLEPQFAPVFTAHDIMNLDNYNAYLRLLSSNQPVKPFNIETLPFTRGDLMVAQNVKELSYQKYGRDRAEVEAEIMKKYAK